MQHKKQAAVKKLCRDCGAQILGKYAAKNHICRPVRAVESRDAGLAKQRRKA